MKNRVEKKRRMRLMVTRRNMIVGRGRAGELILILDQVRKHSMCGAQLSCDVGQIRGG